MSVIRTSKSVTNRQNIYFRLKEKGVVMSYKYSQCLEKNLECRVLPNTTHYNEYIKSIDSGRCNIYSHSAGDWFCVNSKEDCLCCKEEEAMAKILRFYY